LQLLGDQYTLQIIQVLLKRAPQRFIELEQQIEGISPRTLSARLKQMDAAGLLTRHQYASLPPKVEYTLTDRSQALAGVVDALTTWADWAY
jgi:DNA-binding HxlR family transcriptional regulator